MPVLDGEALFEGAGDLAATGDLNYHEALAWAGSGVLDVLAVKVPNRIAARFAGSGGMNVVTIAPRLVASARFVGDGSFGLSWNYQAHVLSTALTRRLSFPANPAVPFVRRESATYHVASARFRGSGNLDALAS